MKQMKTSLTTITLLLSQIARTRWATFSQGPLRVVRVASVEGEVPELLELEERRLPLLARTWRTVQSSPKTQRYQPTIHYSVSCCVIGVYYANIYILEDLILSPATALQDTADNFLELLDNSPSNALAELINCVLRSCGCNSSIDSDQVMDTDNAVDVLDEFTEGFKTVRLYDTRIILTHPFESTGNHASISNRV
jgi:hypothetical protein